MEQKNIVFLLSLMVLLLISYTTSARLLPTINSQENKKIESNGIISNNPISSQVQEDFNDKSVSVKILISLSSNSCERTFSPQLQEPPTFYQK
uniref:Phytosulfokine peptide n=1 Tax=Solanum tuberosum TaxID=4113 RepID=M0ZS54_SOLTU